MFKSEIKEVVKINKYKNIKIKVGNLKFDSKKEFKVYQRLKLLEKIGMIKNLQMQVPFTLIEKSKHGRKIVYKADFVYEENGKIKIIDVKGFKTDVYKLKKRLMAEKGLIIEEL